MIIPLPPSHPSPMGHRPARVARAFTLLEVLMALGISIGLLVVVLYFYQQASQVRAEAIRETELLGSARLLMDRLTAELRTCRADNFLLMGLMGTSNSIELVCAGMPRPPAWSTEELDIPLPASSDLKIISYTLNFSGDETNVTGISRSHEALLELPPDSAVFFDDVFYGDAFADEEPAVSGLGESGGGGAVEPRSLAVPSWLGESSGEEFLTDHLRYLRFRYFSGRAWEDDWNTLELPMAVEVNLGIEPLPPDTPPEEYPFELFRRVIYLPASVRPEEEDQSSESAEGESAETEPMEPSFEDLP